MAPQELTHWTSGLFLGLNSPERHHRLGVLVRRAAVASNAASGSRVASRSCINEARDGAIPAPASGLAVAFLDRRTSGEPRKCFGPTIEQPCRIGSADHCPIGGDVNAPFQAGGAKVVKRSRFGGRGRRRNDHGPKLVDLPLLVQDHFREGGPERGLRHPAGGFQVGESSMRTGEVPGARNGHNRVCFRLQQGKPSHGNGAAATVPDVAGWNARQGGSNAIWSQG